MRSEFSQYHLLVLFVRFRDPEFSTIASIFVCVRLKLFIPISRIILTLLNILPDTFFIFISFMKSPFESVKIARFLIQASYSVWQLSIHNGQSFFRNPSFQIDRFIASHTI
jgi:hypothetical protein